MVFSGGSGSGGISPGGGNGTMRVWNSSQIEAIKEAQQREEEMIEREARREAEDARRKALEEGDRRRREEAEARRRAVEEDMKRMLEEEEEREREERAEARKREEAELARAVLERRREEEERERRIKLEMEEKRQREREELKRKVKEEKFKKFEKLPQTEEKSSVVPSKKREDAGGGNLLVSRFEGMTRFRQAEEEKLKEKVEATKKKRHPYAVAATAGKAGKEKLRRSAQKIAGAVARGRSRSKLTKAISKEMERMFSSSKERVGSGRLLPPQEESQEHNEHNPRERGRTKLRSSSRGSLSRLPGRSASRESLVRGLKRSRSSQKVQHVEVQPRGDRKTVGEMQNYLISRVLFDGQEDVCVQSKRPKMKQEGKGRRAEADQRMSGFVEEEAEEWERRRREEEEVQWREKAFGEYRQEMEKYLSLFGEEEEAGGRDLKRNRGEGARDERGKMLSRKPLAKLEDLKGRFERSEFGASSKKEAPTSPVGKLQVEEIFSEGPRDDGRREEKKEYVPVIIDGDAFKRTMTKFEDYRSEEDEREKRKRELQAKAEERRKEQERRRAEEEERQRREEERLRLAEEERRREDEKRALEEEKYREEHREEQLKRQIMEELAKLKKLEEVQREKVARDNKKRELMIQIQEEVSRIKKKEEEAARQKKEEEETPLWIKMVIDAEERKAHLSEKGPSDEEKKNLIPEVQRQDSGSSYSSKASSSNSSSYTSCRSTSKESKKVALMREDSSTFAASVEAMLDMIGEDEAKALAEEIGQQQQDEEQDISESDDEDDFVEASGPKSAKQLERDGEMKELEEDVQAFLDLMNEDECRQLVEEFEESEKDREKTKQQRQEQQRQFLLQQQPEKRNHKEKPKFLVSISQVKSSLLEQKSPTSPNAASLSPAGAVNVNRAREILMNKFTKKNDDGSADKSRSSSSSKKSYKCTSLKKMFDKKSEDSGPRGPQVKRRKAIIDVPVVPSIEEQLQKAKEKNSAKKWQYQVNPKVPETSEQKDPSDSRKIAAAAAAAAKDRKKQSLMMEDLMRSHPDEQEDFLSEVRDYVHHKRRVGDDGVGGGDEGDNLRALVNTYLELAEERSSSKEAAGGKGGEGNRSSFNFVPSTDHIKQKLASTQQAKKKSLAPMQVGKIKDPDALVLSMGNDRQPKKSQEVDNYACQTLKSRYEKLDNERRESESVGMSREKQRAMQKKIWGAASSIEKETPAEGESKQKKKEWKWKQKLQESASLLPNVLSPPSSSSEKKENPRILPKKNEDIEKLEENKRLIMESVQRREEEFQQLMEELKALPAHDDGEVPAVDFDDVFQSYLDAVDKGNRRDKASLPELGAPVRISSIKSKMQKGAKGEDKRANKTVGKITPMDVGFGGEEKDDGKGSLDKDPVLGTLHTNKIKKMFEERQREKAAAAAKRKQPEKVWEPPQKPAKQEAPAKKTESIPKWKVAQQQQQQQLLLQQQKTDFGQKNHESERYARNFPDSGNRAPVSEWAHISDPEEKRRAILAKYGFKPAEQRRRQQDEDEDFSELGTIPSHVLKDEILYQRYMRQQLDIDSDSDSASSESIPSPLSSTTRLEKKPQPVRKKSSFRKALGSFKQLAAGKSSEKVNSSKGSNTDIPGTCRSLKSKFDKSLSTLLRGSKGNLTSSVDSDEKRKSCSDLKELWEQKLNPSRSKKDPTEGPKPLRQQRPAAPPPGVGGRHVENVKNKLKTGEDSKSLVRRFFDREQSLSGAKGEYVKQTREALQQQQQQQQQQPREVKTDFDSEEVNSIMRMLQTGSLSVEDCQRSLEEAERNLKRKYFDGLCQSINSGNGNNPGGGGERTAQLQKKLASSMTPLGQPSRPMPNPGTGNTAEMREELQNKLAGSGDGSGDSINDWHKKNYEEQKNRISEELQGLRSEGSLAAARNELSRKFAGSDGRQHGRRRHFDGNQGGSNNVSSLRGQLARQFSDPEEKARMGGHGVTPQAREAAQERARQLFLENCSELQQMSSSKQAPGFAAGGGNVGAMRGKLASNMAGQQQQLRQRQPLPPQRMKRTRSMDNALQQQQQPHHHPSYHHDLNASASAKSIAQLQEMLATSMQPGASGLEVVYTPSSPSSPSSTDAVATVREKLESLFDGNSEEWNRIFPPDCDSCSNLRKTLEDNMRKSQPASARQQQQHHFQPQPPPRSGPPSKAVSTAQRGLIKMFSNEYDQGRKAGGGFSPAGNTGSIAEKRKILMADQQHQQQQQQQPGARSQRSAGMSMRKDQLEALFSDSQEGGHPSGKINFSPSNGSSSRCSALQRTLQEQQRQQQRGPDPRPPVSSSHGLASTRNMLDSFFSGGGGQQQQPALYRQPPPRTKSCSDVKHLLERRMAGEIIDDEDDYKNDYGVHESGRSDRVQSLRRQLSDFYSGGDADVKGPPPNKSQKYFPNSRSTCNSLREALEKQQTMDASSSGAHGYNSSDQECGPSESVAQLRSKLSSIWNSSSGAQQRSQPFHGLHQTKSCSNVKNLLQEKWSGGGQYGGRQVAVVAPSVSVSNMKSLFDSCYSSLPQSDRSLDAALSTMAGDPARRRAFEQMMDVLETGASTLESEGERGAVRAELDNLRRTLQLRSLDSAPGADRTDFEEKQQELRRELEAVRAARGTIDKELLARLVSGEEDRAWRQQGGREAELEAVRARRRATSMEDVNDWHRKNYQEQKDKIQFELEALRGRVKTSLMKIEQGGSAIDRDRLEQELEAVRAARKRYNLLESELASGGANGAFTERQRIQNELEALRESRKGSSLNKINFGVDRSGKGGRGSSDLDPETLRELRSSNSKVKAMFEKNAPKYKFGGSGEKLLQEEDDDGGKDDDLMLRPRRGRGRQAQQQQKGQDERKWVADTISKYFDVIVEEEEEDDRSRSRKNNNNGNNEDDDENQEIFYPDSDDEDGEGYEMSQLGKGEQFKSTSNIRGMLSQVLTKVSSNVGTSKEALVGTFKHKLAATSGGQGQAPVGTTDL